MALGWFGLTTKKARELEEKLLPMSLRATDPLDGSLVIPGFHHDASTIAVDGTFQHTAALINEYREMATDPDVDLAIDDIVNSIVTSEEDVVPVKLNTSKLEITDKMVDILNREFDSILDMLQFKENGYELIRSWYTDGRQFFQPILDPNNQKAGIRKIVFLDTRTIQKVKIVHKKPATRGGQNIEVIEKAETMFFYNPYWAPEYNAIAGNSSYAAMTSIHTQKIPENDIIYVHSGLKDPVTGVVISDLEKSKKQLNNLRMMRDAQVIYRITRSVEKRVFRVDVGSLPPKQAEEQMKKIIRQHKTKLLYDPKSGKVNGKTHQQSLIEDFWFPVREGGRSSDVSTLAGAQNLSEIDDILYFQKLLYRSLNVPEGRLQDQQPMLFGNRNTEMTRDEWKYNKFIMRKRRRYGSSVFTPLLKLQLITKRIVTEDEWNKYYASDLNYEWMSDSWAEEQQETDALMNKFNNLGALQEYVGKYISDDFVYDKVLRMTPEDIERERKRITEMKEEQAKEEDDKFIRAEKLKAELSTDNDDEED